MRWFFKCIIVLGLAFSSLIIVDWVLPKNLTTTQISGIFRGMERGYSRHSRGGIRLTHFKVKLEEQKGYFPIFTDDFKKMEEGDAVTLRSTKILKSPFELIHESSGFQTKPALGLYSYFICVPIVMGLLSFAVLYFREKSELLFTVGLIDIPLLGVTLYLCYN